MVARSEIEKEFPVCGEFETFSIRRTSILAVLNVEEPYDYITSILSSTVRHFVRRNLVGTIIVATEVRPLHSFSLTYRATLFDQQQIVSDGETGDAILGPNLKSVAWNTYFLSLLGATVASEASE